MDDDVELCELVARSTSGAKGAAQALGGENYSLIVLDVMLPGLNGFEVLRRVRTALASRVPVLRLTARGEETDRIIMGLEIGADDYYLTKPFNSRELSARIRAILRRFQFAELPRGETKLQFLRSGDIEIELGARLARQKGAIVDLTGAEFDLLVLLLENAGVVVTKQELVNAVLGRELSPYDRSIDNLISNLRRKLGRDGVPGVERIKAVRGTVTFTLRHVQFWRIPHIADGVYALSAVFDAKPFPQDFLWFWSAMALTVIALTTVVANAQSQSEETDSSWIAPGLARQRGGPSGASQRRMGRDGRGGPGEIVQIAAAVMDAGGLSATTRYFDRLEKADVWKKPILAGHLSSMRAAKV